MRTKARPTRYPEYTAESNAGALIQVIRTTWNKSARGGELASKRNAVPLAFAVSQENLLDASGFFLVEEQIWGHSNQFVQPLHVRHLRPASSEPYRYRCLTVERSPQRLQIHFDGDSLETGAPLRPFTRSFVVLDRQWVRVIWNGRFSHEDCETWSYEQIIINVAHFKEKPDGSVFVNSEPDAELKALSLLW